MVRERAQGKVGLAGMLALTAGFVDAVGFVVLFHLFTAHLSGNSITMGAHLGRGEWQKALHWALPIPAFVLGVAAGAALTEALLRRGCRSTYAAVLGLEAVLLLAFLVLGSAVAEDGVVPLTPTWRFGLLTALPASAMGVQNAALRRIGGVKVHTTFITGMLTSAAEEAVQYLFWLHDQSVRHPGRWGLLLRLSPRQTALRQALLRFGLWLAYVAGAVVGAALHMRWGLICLTVPVACLVGIVVRDLLSPLSGSNARGVASR